MFYNNSITSLPTGMDLPALTNGQSMFQGNSLTSLPTGMNLPALTNGYAMFYNNSLTSLPAGMELPLLTNGTFMFEGSTLSNYSAFLVAMEAANSNTGVTFHGGNSTYDAAVSAAATARGSVVGAYSCMGNYRRRTSLTHESQPRTVTSFE